MSQQHNWERAGSWKGRTVGCGYDLKPDESMLDSLRRMEAGRMFDSWQI